MTVLMRNRHGVSRSQFSEYTPKVLYRLHANQFDALLVGGALRDLLRGRAPRDVDVVTNASIEEIQQLFRNSKVVGKRFPMVHGYFGSPVMEISSLKPNLEGSSGTEARNFDLILPLQRADIWFSHSL